MIVDDRTSTCEVCNREPAECQVPVNEGAIAMCWRCAHHVADHGISIGTAAVATCACRREDIYPTSTSTVEPSEGN